MSPTPAIQSVTGRLVILLAILICGTSTTLTYFSLRELDGLRAELRNQATQNKALVQSIDLMRLERGTEGQGIDAVLEHIKVWAAQLQKSSTSAVELPRIQEHLDSAYSATAALGPSVFDRLVEAIEATEDDEVRKALLRAASFSDAERSNDLLVRVIRGTALSPSSRFRMIAIEQLLHDDKARAGETIIHVLRTQSVDGRKLSALDPDAAPINAGIGTNNFPEFAGLIPMLIRSEHPDTETVIEEVLRARRHDLLTYQVCVKELGRMKTRNAVDRIQDLYLNQPGTIMDRPLFRNHCLQAIAEILGAEALPFFKQALDIEKNETVINKLQALLQQFG